MVLYHIFLLFNCILSISVRIFEEALLEKFRVRSPRDKWRHDIKEITLKSNEKTRTLASIFASFSLDRPYTYIYVLLSNSRVHFGVHVLQRAHATV